MAYKERIIDKTLEKRLKTIGGVLIVGPKGCGKTTTAKQFVKSVVEFQDEDLRSNYLKIADTIPSKLLEGAKPRLFDEWQDAPKIWGAIRQSIDDEQKPGLYLLTGSSSQKVQTPHTGTLRIASLEMLPLSLYESGESNGSISLKDLFDNPKSYQGATSTLSFDELVYAICRGGWPSCFNVEDKEDKLEIARVLFEQTVKTDLTNISKVRHNENITRALLRSYARNICTLSAYQTIYEDVSRNNTCSLKTLVSYINDLEALYIISDVEAWSPAIRSKTAIRSSRKRNFIDPSIAVAALGIGPSYLEKDLNTLGFLFESLVIRDLKVYSSALGGHLSYYHDRLDVEADAIIHLNDGRYALVEAKLGDSAIEQGAKNLNKIESLIIKHNQKSKIQMPLPTLKMVVTATPYGYAREDGVLIVPIGALKD